MGTNDSGLYEDGESSCPRRSTRARTGPRKTVGGEFFQAHDGKYARVLEAWQQLWEEDIKGKILYAQCSEVVMQYLRTSFKANQLMTGHGNMEEYLQIFRLEQTDGRAAPVCIWSRQTK